MIKPKTNYIFQLRYDDDEVFEECNDLELIKEFAEEDGFDIIHIGKCIKVEVAALVKNEETNEWELINTYDTVHPVRMSDLEKGE